jgi:hypothetical protein
MTITVYGVIAAEVPPPPATYTPIILPIIDPTPFHRVFDVANTEDPTGLARTLLQLMSPSLSLGQAVAETLCQLEIYQNGTHHDDNVDGETLHLHELFDRTRHSWISHSQPFAELFGEALRYQVFVYNKLLVHAHNRIIGYRLGGSRTYQWHLAERVSLAAADDTVPSGSLGYPRARVFAFFYQL